MFEFKKLCDICEEMTAFERGTVLTQSSAEILQRLRRLHIPEIDPVKTLAGFIIGSIVADGKFNERDYVIIYPSLLRFFGDDFDLSSIKGAFYHAFDLRKTISEYTEKMLTVLDKLDEELKSDIITVCLCIAATDGKISLKEKIYIRRLCRV